MEGASACGSPASCQFAPLGIHATVVEPGYFRTDFLDADSLAVSTEMPAYAAAGFTTSSRVIRCGWRRLRISALEGPAGQGGGMRAGGRDEGVRSLSPRGRGLGRGGAPQGRLRSSFAGASPSPPARGGRGEKGQPLVPASRSAPSLRNSTPARPEQLPRPRFRDPPPTGGYTEAIPPPPGGTMTMETTPWPEPSCSKWISGLPPSP